MALRYLLRVRNAAQHEQVRPAAHHHPAGLVSVVETDALSLFVTPDAPWVSMTHGVVIGHLFERGDFNGGACGAECSGGSARGPRDLLRNFWGAYIACFQTVDGLEVVRDPSGQLPCYVAITDRITAFASDIDLLVAAGIVTPAIDWRQLSRSLFMPDLLEARTAIAGVEELLPGMAIRISGGVSRRFVRWSPWDHVNATPPSPEALHDVVGQCIARWSDCFGRIVVGASGGLDSSITAAALAPREKLDAVTISTADAHGDESDLARLLCAHLGLPLTEARYDLAAIAIGRSSVAHRPRPGGRAQLQAYDAVVERMMGIDPAAAFVTGVGGDNVFQYSQSARPVIDRLRREGPSRGVAATIADVGRLTGASHWTVMRYAARHLRSSPRTVWAGDPRYLSSDAILASSDHPPDHPWLEAPDNALPGKVAHVAMLTRAQTYMDTHDRRLPFTTLHPLLSQPIVETCLAVPSWQACRGGSNRAHAREAFRDDLPAAIIERRGKGGPDSFAIAILRTRLREIRQILLDGLLVRQGILCRSALEAGLTERAIMVGDDYVRLLLLLDTEAWARHWAGCG